MRNVVVRAEPERLLHRLPMVIAGICSLAVVILVLPYVVLLALLVGGTGLTLAAVARDEVAAHRAAVITSVGFGLTVGPFVYLLLALIVAIS